MLFRTHLAFGFLIGLYLVDYFKVEKQILFIAVLLFFSVFPDIDNSSSKISKGLRPFSYLSSLFSHRGVFHTVYFPLVISAVFFVFGLKFAGMAVIFGYLGHLLLDMATKKGVRLFYPLSRMKARGIIKVGSLAEKIIFFILGVLIVCKLIGI
ncbi:metal-dependent hydrolase [Candidatus Woesearchaeota archaeon]|nr:metal-dependent hydrolase [Candidatus Woesearchaeota archaeon]